MRTLLALLSAFIVSSAFAQRDTRHMIEFSAENLLQTTLSFDRSNSRGLGGDNDTQLDVNLNYAYALPQARRLQVGSRVNYNKGTEAGFGDFENYGLELGAILNFSNWQQQVDLMNSAYVSLFLGLGWANEYSGLADRKDEFTSATAAIGKRFSLNNWLNVDHLTYSPEVALETINSTTGSTLEYSQSLQFRLLQFSFLW